MNRVILLGTAVVILALPMLAEAQSGRAGTIETYRASKDGSLSGIVTGKPGIGLKETIVSAKNKDSGAVTTITTDGSGAFQFTGLPDGYYSVSVLVSGMDQPVVNFGDAGVFQFTQTRKQVSIPKMNPPVTQKPNPQLDPSPQNGPRGPLVITPRGRYL